MYIIPLVNRIIKLYDKTFTKKIRLYRPPIGCNPHTVQIQPCALNLIPSGLQLEELSVAQNKVVILIDPSSTQINILTFTVDDEVLTAMTA